MSSQESRTSFPKTMQIGDKTWLKGDEVTITSEPYMMHGGEFQNAVTEDGKEICIATPAQTAKNVQDFQSDWAKQQAEFRNLKQTI